MILSVLVLSHVSRTRKLRRLVKMLHPSDAVEVVVLWNRGGVDRSAYYNALVVDAGGEYVCFVDDDDRVPAHYCDTLVEALKTKPDYVGFLVEVNDLSDKPINVRWRKYEASHSIRWRGWYQEQNRFFRDVVHLNPIRADIARGVPFPEGRSLDHDWSMRVRPLIAREVFVDEVMYFYDFNQSTGIPNDRDMRKVVRPVLPDGFRYHPDSEN